MREPTDHPAKPRTLRPMALWTAGILLALGLAWFVGAVGVPAWQVHRVLAEYDAQMAWGLPPLAMLTTETLGGQARAARKLAVYLWLPDGIARHKRTAILCLGQCGPAAVPTLRRMTRSPNDDLRAAAFGTLAWHIPALGPDASLLPLVVCGAYDRAPQVRSSVAGGLKILDAARTKSDQQPWPEVSRALTTLLADPDEAVRFTAVEQTPWLEIPLGTNDPAVITAIVRALIDPSAEVRRAAAVRIWLCDLSLVSGDAEVIATLARALADPSADVRRVAAQVLEVCGEHAQTAVPALERLRGDPDEDVRSAAAEALKKIREKEQAR